MRNRFCNIAHLLHEYILETVNWLKKLKVTDGESLTAVISVTKRSFLSFWYLLPYLWSFHLLHPHENFSFFCLFLISHQQIQGRTRSMIISVLYFYYYYFLVWASIGNLTRAWKSRPSIAKLSRYIIIHYLENQHTTTWFNNSAVSTHHTSTSSFKPKLVTGYFCFDLTHTLILKSISIWGG